MGRNPVIGRQGPKYHAATIPAEADAAPRQRVQPLAPEFPPCCVANLTRRRNVPPARFA